MRSIRPALAALLALAALAGCGSSDDGGAPPAATRSSVFPVTVTHRLGTTTVPAEPRRIAVVGLTEQDIVLALGENPIATTEWYGEHPYAVWPWARRALGTAKPTVLSNKDAFQFERIAALRPDLIGTNAGIKRADYRKLSAIAPTIAGVVGGTDYFSRGTSRPCSSPARWARRPRAAPWSSASRTPTRRPLPSTRSSATRR
jgi:iron complex transport system substrate-binding protein